MAHDVFVSYPAEAKSTADAVTAALEGNGIRCWIAPRDVRPGSDWSEAIVEAIERSRLMVLIFSKEANASQHIKREVERAVDANLPIIPMRIENVSPSKGLSYFISSPHWLDAMSPPFEQHLTRLVDTVRQMLGRAGETGPAVTTTPAVAATPAIEYGVGPARPWLPWVLGGAASVLLGGVVLLYGIRSAQVIRAPATAPAVAANPAPPAGAAPAAGSEQASARSALRYHLDRYVGDLEKLDRRAALLVAGRGREVQLYRQTMRPPVAAEFDARTAEALAMELEELPLYSSVGSGQYGDRDNTFASAGASSEDLAAFRDTVPVLQNTGRRVAAAVREVAALQRIEALRKQYAPDLAPLPDDYANASLAVYCRGYVLMSQLAALAATNVIGRIPGAHEQVGARMEALRVLPAVDLARFDAASVTAVAGEVHELWEETRPLVAQLAAARQELSASAAAAWCPGVPEGDRPATGDTPEQAIEKARALRAAGNLAAADGALLAYALLFEPSDSTAVDVAEAALSFGRAARSLGVSGGLLITGADRLGDDWNSGLQDGVVLIAYAGQRVTTPAELAAAMRAAPEGQQPRVEIAYRDETGAWVKRTLARRSNAPLSATLTPF